MRKLFILLAVLSAMVSCSSSEEIIWESNEGKSDVVVYVVNQQVVERTDTLALVKWQFESSYVKGKKKTDYSELVGTDFILKVDSANNVLEIEYSKALLKKLSRNYRTQLGKLMRDVNKSNGYGKPLKKSREKQIVANYENKYSDKTKFNKLMKYRLGFDEKKVNIYKKQQN